MSVRDEGLGAFGFRFGMGAAWMIKSFRSGF